MDDLQRIDDLAKIWAKSFSDVFKDDKQKGPNLTRGKAVKAAVRFAKQDFEAENRVMTAVQLKILKTKCELFFNKFNGA